MGCGRNPADLRIRRVAARFGLAVRFSAELRCGKVAAPKHSAEAGSIIARRTQGDRMTERLS
jgi:hypothetical protein